MYTDLLTLFHDFRVYGGDDGTGLLDKSNLLVLAQTCKLIGNVESVVTYTMLDRAFLQVAEGEHKIDFATFHLFINALEAVCPLTRDEIIETMLSSGPPTDHLLYKEGRRNENDDNFD